MKALKLLVLLLAASACTEEDKTVYHVDPELQPYVDSFYAEAEKHGKSFPKENLIVVLKKGLPVTARTIRQTNSPDGNQTTIEMDEDYFNSHRSEGTSCIESVMFHEFGHARLGREHINTYSIMDPAIGESCYMNGYPNAREVLVDELFANAP